MLPCVFLCCFFSLIFLVFAMVSVAISSLFVSRSVVVGEGEESRMWVHLDL